MSDQDPLIELLRDSFDAIGRRDEEIRNQLTEIEKKLARQGDTLGRVQKLVDGNNGTGFIVRIDRLEQNRSAVEKKLDEISQRLEKVNQQLENDRRTVMAVMWDLLKPMIAAAIAAGTVAASM